MTTSNTTIEEGSCILVIFFLLLPVLICIIKDFTRDFVSFIHPKMNPQDSSYELDALSDDDDESVASEVERASLLNYKDSDDDSDGDVNTNSPHNLMTVTNRNNRNTRDSNHNSMSVRLVDSEHHVLAETQASSETDMLQQLCTNGKLPELILAPILPEYHQFISVDIKPMELILWLLFLTISYIALRSMVVSKNMRYNFKYAAVEMQDILELCLRGILVYIFGNIAQRFAMKFFLWIGWFVLFYPFVFQICPTSLKIDTEVSMDWTLISICIFVGISNVYIVLDNFYYVWQIKRWWIYGYASFFLMVVYHFIFIKSGNENLYIHIHHHHWSFLLSLFLHSKKESSVVMHALLTAIFVHGITVFGCENLFDYKSLVGTDATN